MSTGVIGLGYVGLPLAVAFAEVGEHVVAVDVDPRKIAAVRAGDSYVEDVSADRLRRALPRSMRRLTTSRWRGRTRS